jgi:hypothetical protein
VVSEAIRDVSADELAAAGFTRKRILAADCTPMWPRKVMESVDNSMDGLSLALKTRKLV